MYDHAVDNASMLARYEHALTIEQFVAVAAANQLLCASFARGSVAADDLVDRANQLTRRRHPLVLLEDWCGDEVSSIPALATLARASETLDVKIPARDANPDLMDAHRTSGTRSIPVMIVFDEAFHELGWWGPRPAPLQSWVRSDGETLEKISRYREVRRWNARDRAQTTPEEILCLLGSTPTARAA
ncbi:thioredoxin family protein [Gemmatimonas sp.]|uniref:thioredoxin family protein n=1 Tax=Gemmatimonas sp. TaxID=1962908 RepID=UPI00286E9705|nr:thioredoxin family protein [Gemmatimonas sp.]